MGRHVCRELLSYLIPIRLLQENTNYYSSRMGRKIKDLPSLSHTLSKRRKKEFAKKTKIVREQNQNCSRTKSKLFAPPISGPDDSVPSAFFLSFFPFFLLAHTYRLTLWQIGIIVLSTNVISMLTSNRIVSQRRLNKIIPRFTSRDNNTNTK